jgi:hypothetical protein
VARRELPAQAFRDQMTSAVQELTLPRAARLGRSSSAISTTWAAPPGRLRRRSWRCGRSAARKNFPNYAAGTWGPAAADELLAREGRTWVTTEAVGR